MGKSTKKLLNNAIWLLCEWNGTKISELSIKRDHVHLVVSGLVDVSLGVNMK